MHTRLIVLDTETTGLNYKEGDKLIEIACVVIENRRKTDQYYHTYLNPQTPVKKEAFAVHGLSDVFLKNQPTFAEIKDEFLAFIGTDKIIAHNASFDMNFINAALQSHGEMILNYNRVIDTLKIARQKYRNNCSLDDLCKRFSIDNKNRVKHGALIDASLLASIYLLMTEEDQVKIQMSLDKWQNKTIQCEQEMQNYNTREFFNSLDEQHLHQTMLQKIRNPIWLEVETDSK